MNAAPIRTVLSIAGSDSGGGAGVQADLKAFARCGVHGTTAIAAITAQNTVGVRAVHPVPADVIVAQVEAVAEDIGIDAVKIGMLGSAEAITAVARALRRLPAAVPVVVDPVMVAESGARLLDVGAERALVAELLPLATVVTPNLPEARVLTGASESTDSGELARAVHTLGPRVAVVTGGHRAGSGDAGSGDETSDVYFDGRELVEIAGPRHPDGASHGSGCTHSAVLAAQLALGHDPLEAARVARRVAGEAVANGLTEVGHGAGPVDVLGLRRR